MTTPPNAVIAQGPVGRERVFAGRYRAIRQLGIGGMASVYLAEDTRLGRQVAVKRLHADSPEEMAARLEREAKLGASLSHPNIVSVYDIAIDHEGVLIIMEYVEGPTLAAALSAGALPQERATAMLDDVAGALDHAHRQGIVHRDVKPANVLLGRDAVKLADLGIATAAERTQITRSGVLLGTPSYMAPEQLEGGEVSPRTDVYALGVVAFESLSGRRAREGRTPLEIAHRVTTESPPDLREAWPGAPPAAARLLQRAMSRDPADRPESAGKLVSDLRSALAGADIEEAAVAAPVRPEDLTGDSLARGGRRLRPLATAAATAALIAGSLAWGLGGGEEGAGPTAAPVAERPNDPSADKDRARGRDATGVSTAAESTNGSAAVRPAVGGTQAPGNASGGSERRKPTGESKERGESSETGGGGAQPDPGAQPAVRPTGEAPTGDPEPAPDPAPPAGGATDGDGGDPGGGGTEGSSSEPAE